MGERVGLRRRLLLKLLGIGSAAATAGCGDEGTGTQSENVAESGYEFIVIGSGAGGAPLACNLARRGHRVLLIEAGSDEGHHKSQQVPALHVRSTEEPTMQWDYFVKHYDDPAQAALDPKFVADPGPAHEAGVWYPRAGTLGGCTAHHAMITVYPHASDWDYIADITGDESWRATAMRRYFEILERCLYIDQKKTSEAAGHGFKGWLSTTLPDASAALKDLKLQKVVLAAAKALSLEAFSGGPLSSIFNGSAFPLKQLIDLLKRDLNNAAAGRDQAEGLFSVPQATDKKNRKGPRELILRTVEDGHPLVVLTKALATRIVFEEGSAGKPRAVGVEVVEGEFLYRASPLADPGGELGAPRVFRAEREVIVSAGVFNTPQLLKLSGIGPREELEAFGIEVKVDLPGVGTNMQDRYEVGVVSEAGGAFNTVEDCTFGVLPDPCLDEWEKGEGVYVNNGAVASVIKKSRPEEPNTDLIIFGLPGHFSGYYPGYGTTDVFAHKDRFTWAVLKAHTENTAGTVTLRSADPRDTPDIRFKYFHEGSTDAGQDTRDLEAMVEGVKFARQIGRQADHAMLFGKFEEVAPGPAVSTDADIAAFVRNEAWGHHASCTCPIGGDGDPMAVLDSQFRVRGTEGLRVVDASVFPRIPGFFIVVPIYMISEKATDVILASMGEERV